MDRQMKKLAEYFEAHAWKSSAFTDRFKLPTRKPSINSRGPGRLREVLDDQKRLPKKIRYLRP